MIHSVEKLKKRQKLSIGELRELFRQREEWPEDISWQLARCALNMGENFYAYDVAEKIEPANEKEAWQKIHIMSLALARSGSLNHAAELLQELPESDNTEIVGLKSRILKDMASNTVELEKRKELFMQAATLNLEIFKSKRQYYNGINAASCLFMADQKEQAQRLVRDEVLPLCDEEKVQDLWLIATRAECFLLLEDFSMAAEYYKQTVQMAISEHQLGNLASTLKQFYMLGQNFHSEKISNIISKMNLPKVAIFSGHMIDRPGRKTPRFPAESEEQVRQELAEIIKKQNIKIAFASCACGGDIIFVEEILKVGGECFILPPLPLEQTIVNSVDIIPGAQWKQRLEKILQHENTILLDAESDEIGVDDDAIVYDFSNRFLLGAAIHRAASSHFPLCGVTVWNLEKSGLVGGTDSAVALWKKKKLPIEIVTPEVKK